MDVVLCCNNKTVFSVVRFCIKTAGHVAPNEANLVFKAFDLGHKLMQHISVITNNDAIWSFLS